jgi:hypothetical protein
MTTKNSNKNGQKFQFGIAKNSKQNNATGSNNQNIKTDQTSETTRERRTDKSPMAKLS